MANSAGWLRGPSGASRQRGAGWPCAAWEGRGCRARAAVPMEGRWGPRGPCRGGNPGCCSAHCCILGPADPDPETLAARLRGQMSVLPAPAAGWGQRPDASPCSADKGGVALLRKVMVTLFPFCKLLFCVGLGCASLSPATPGGWVMSTHKKSLYFVWVP